MPKAQDLTGNRYGYLTVIEMAPSFITPSGKKQVAWKVLCDCGTEKIVRGCDLKSGHIVSCGCYNKEKDIGKKQYKDISGQRFGRLIAESYAYTKDKKAYWNCVCDCGNKGIFAARYLLNGDTKSCGCQKRDNSGTHNAIDLTGKKFSRLFVERLAQRRPRKWHCICDCGNKIDVLTNCLTSGHTSSCGCFQKEMVREKLMLDLTGKKFGRLFVEGVNEQSDKLRWNCLCDCGNRIVVDCNSLRSGNTQSCGCFRHDAIIAYRKNDLSNMRFGKLIAIEEIGQDKRGLFIWRCVCDCGNECYISSSSLTSGNTKSCGCMKSEPEDIIDSFLCNNHILFKRQKKFISCKDKSDLYFDFYLPEYNLAIEYDGEFHYIEFPKLGNDLEGQQRRDAIKTQYCEENEILLLRIPYWEKDNIESILTDWLFLYDEKGAGDTE